MVVLAVSGWVLITPIVCCFLGGLVLMALGEGLLALREIALNTRAVLPDTTSATESSRYAALGGLSGILFALGMISILVALFLVILLLRNA